MYNRYSMEIHDDDFVPLNRRGGPGTPPAGPRPPVPGPVPPPPPGPMPGPLPGPHPGPLPPPPPGPPVHNRPAPGDGGLLSGLLGGLRLQRLETDDLLLLGIAWLVLRESGDEDLFLIPAVLFLLGGGD